MATTDTTLTTLEPGRAGGRTRPWRIGMVAGEASGDAQGAYLARELLRRDPSLEIKGVGARLMRDAGVEILRDCTGLAAMGWVETWKKVPYGIGVYRTMCEQVKRRLVDMLILIDFGVINLRLGRYALRQGCPVLIYFPPASWSSDRDRLRDVAYSATRIATPFPQSAEVLAEEGADVTFVGHPLLDVLRPVVERRESGAAKREGTVVALLPGSRDAEITHILPHMLRAARLIAEQVRDVRFVVSVAQTLDRERLAKMVAASGVEASLVDGTQAALEQADVGIITSGTATLEAAIVGLPMVAVYRAGRIPFLHYQLFWWPRVDPFSMPNILAGRKIIPELVQREASAEAMAEHALRFLRDRELYARTKHELLEVASRLDGEGAVGKTADIVFDMLAHYAGRGR